VFVGVLRIELALPGNDSLKGKRAVVRRVLDRVRHRFNAAAAEVGALDVHRRARLAFVVVSTEAGHANAMLDQIGNHVAALTDAVVLQRGVELVPMGDDAALGLADDDLTGPDWRDEDLSVPSVQGRARGRGRGR